MRLHAMRGDLCTDAKFCVSTLPNRTDAAYCAPCAADPACKRIMCNDRLNREKSTKNIDKRQTHYLRCRKPTN